MDTYSIPATRIDDELPESLRIPASDIRLGKRIGRGGFSTVHKAFWRGQPCAAKVVHTTDVRAIQKEVAILSKLDHPHVIRCIGFSVDTAGDLSLSSVVDHSSLCMILMELMDSDLRHVIDKRLANKFHRRKVPFTEPEAVNILEQIAAGMEYLHDRGVFHGDLKASNILVAPSRGPGMHVKITDFGVSMMVKRDPSKNSEEFVRTKHFRGVVGTSGYISPEVSSSNNGRGHVGTAYYSAPEVATWRPYDFYTVKADVYSFAMTCFEILSGCVPFKDVKRGEIAGMVSRGVRPVLPVGLDHRLIELIGRCWHRIPSKRPGFDEIRVRLVAVQEKERYGRRVGHIFQCVREPKTDITPKAGVPEGLYSGSSMGQRQLSTILQSQESFASFMLRDPRGASLFLHGDGVADGGPGPNRIQGEKEEFKQENTKSKEMRDGVKRGV